MKFEIDLAVPFAIGDTVYFIENEYNKSCKICDGEKTIEVKDKLFTCPECDGTGLLPERIIKTGTISDIYVAEVSTFAFNLSVKIISGGVEMVFKAEIYKSKPFKTFYHNKTSYFISTEIEAIERDLNLHRP